MTDLHQSKVYMLDKCEGISSFGALDNLKKRIGTQKAGHAGTLDPFATGLLIAMSGKMTRAVSLVSEMPKEYLARIRFGEETDTLDKDGRIVACSDIPEYKEILTALESFKGEITQTPPIFSAIKINGRRAYKSARQGLHPVLPERKVHIYICEIISWNSPDLDLRIKCSKGTYIRSLARDLGLACNSRAYCEELRRTAIGPFTVEMTSDEGLSAETFFEVIGIPFIMVQKSVAEAMNVGRPIRSIPEFLPPDADMVFVQNEQGIDVALLDRVAGQWVYRIVFQVSGSLL